MYAERALQNARRNPFYLLSALSMLLGCFALSRHLTLVPGQWMPIVLLIGVLQVYELLLLGMAVHLNLRRAAGPDAATLFLLELVFLVDATHLNAELAASSPAVAPWVSAALLVLGAVKLHCLRSALGLTSRRVLAVATAGLGLILFLPVAVRVLHFTGGEAANPETKALLMYGLWWIVGLAPIACFWAERKPERSSHPDAPAMVRAILTFPVASLFLHAIALHWLYDLAFYASYATPFLLGASAYASLTFRDELDGFQLLARWAAPLSAVLLSTNSPELLSFGWDGPSFLPLVIVSPLRVALLALALIWALHHLLENEKIFGWAASGSLLLALSGHSASSIGRTWSGIVPDTAAELGVSSILIAFALLALGFARSLAASRYGG